MTERNISENLKLPTLHLGGELPASIVEAFRRQCEQRHQQKYGALTKAVELWIELPSELQAKFLDGSLTGSPFIDLISQAVEKYLSSIKRRPSSKG